LEKSKQKIKQNVAKIKQNFQAIIRKIQLNNRRNPNCLDVVDFLFGFPGLLFEKFAFYCLNFQDSSKIEENPKKKTCFFIVLILLFLFVLISLFVLIWAVKLGWDCN
jgi:hypothetical protein